MAHAHGPEFQGGHGDPLTQRTLPLFFEVVRVLVEAGVTVVAEAAFQDRLWRPGLEPLTEKSRLRIVRCRVDAAVSFGRASARADAGESRLRAHGDSTIGKGIAEWAQAFEAFEHVSLPAPSLDVDTTDGYDPGLEQVVDFVNRD
jgi:predicted kinase